LGSLILLAAALKIVIVNDMSDVTTSPGQPEIAADLARRLGLILGALAAVVARRFLKVPGRMELIVPLWRWLTHAARRFEQAALRPVRTAQTRGPQTRTAVGTAKAARVRLPSAQGWMVRALGWEAVGHASQLGHLLTDPEMQALMAASPAVARVLRPLCRVLGVQPMPAALLAVKAAPVAPVARPKRVRVRRSARAIREALSVEGCEGFKNRPAEDWMWPRRR